MQQGSARETQPEIPFLDTANNGAVPAVDVQGGPSLPSPSWDSWFRLLVEHANDLIYLHAPDGKILFVNRRLEDVTGWSREEIVGRNILEFLAPDYRPSALARREGQVMPGGGRRYETEVICRDGTRIPLEVHSTPVKHQGTVVAWQGIARDIRERRQAQARMEALYETARQVVGILNLDQVLRVIVSHAAQITEALSCSVWLRDEGDDALYCSAWHGEAHLKRFEQIEVVSEHPVAQAFRHRETVVVDCSEMDSGLTSSPGAATIVCFPLTGGGGVFGVLELCYARPAGPDPEELALLATFANHAAAAITNAQLFEAQRRKTQEAAAIGQVGMAIGTLDAESALRVTGAYAYDLFLADVAAVLVLNREGETLRGAFVAERGEETVGDHFPETLPLREHPLLAEVIRGDRCLLVEDTHSHHLAREDPLVHKMRVTTALLAPMSSHGRVDGVLLIGYVTRARLTEVRVRLAETLAQQAAVAIDNARLFEATAAAKREWEATFDAIRDPVCIFSADGKLLRANEAAGAMLNTDVSRLVGHHYREFLYTGHDPDSPDVFSECLARREPVTREVETLSIPGVFQVSAYPLLDGASECVGVVGYLKDITAQREMQARLYHSARLAGVGELAAGVVHNFRNVLMGISGVLDVAVMLLERGGDPGEVRERLAEAQAHVFRGNQVLQRLLDFARGMPQEVGDVRLDGLLADVVALCKAHPASRGIRLRAEIPNDVPAVRADASQLHEVLVNLVLNALQSISGEGSVTIDACLEADKVAIRVTDTGCGIPPEDLERIFEPFYSRRLHGPPGSGIGLSSSLRMIRGMGGDIRVESRVGEGTTVMVELPSTPGR